MSQQQDHMMKLLQLIHSNEGITDDQLRTQINLVSQMTEAYRCDLLVELNKQGYLRVLKNAKGEITYAYQDPQSAKKLDRLDNNDKIVYRLIVDSKSKGMNKTDLKHKSGMTPKMVSSSIKNLENYSLIKSVKAKDKNRLIHFAFDQEPDEGIVGGRFYENGEVNTDMIEVLQKKILGMISSKGKVGYTEVVKYLTDNVEESKDLKEEDIKTLLNTLVLDDLIEDVSIVGKPEFVLSKNSYSAANGRYSAFKSTPCFSCPVFKECHPGGRISPETCLYFEDW